MSAVCGRPGSNYACMTPCTARAPLPTDCRARGRIRSTTAILRGPVDCCRITAVPVSERAAALKMFSVAPAYAAFQELDRGSIEVGQLADFTVLADAPAVR